jgi:hypothetical protein
MSQRAATIESLPVAFEVVKAMQGDNLEWGEDYRLLARQAVESGQTAGQLRGRRSIERWRKGRWKFCKALIEQGKGMCRLVAGFSKR